MLATLVSKPFNEPDWVYEEKHDGGRNLAYRTRNTLEPGAIQKWKRPH